VSVEALIRRYRDGVRVRLAALERARAMLAQDEAAARAVIAREAHALRGSGQTYGFDELTRAAGAVEHADAGAMPARLDALIAALAEVVGGSTPSALSAPQEAAARLRVLVVDDDPETLLAAEAGLRAAGHEVRTAATRAGALEAAAAQQPDVVLLDVLLGDDDGIDAAADLARACACPIVFLTGLDGPADRRRMLAAGAAGVIAKPFDPFALPSRVESLLHGGGAAE
jgi:two-component system, OmpR family, response regulator